MCFRWTLMITIVIATLASCQSQAASDALAVKLDSHTSRQERDAKQTEMREFLWNHWSQRKPATLALTAMSKEGKAVHSEYRIILLRGNTLMMKVSFVADRYGYQGQVIPKAQAGYEVYKVDRVKSDPPGAKAKLTPLPDNAVVPPTKYCSDSKDGMTCRPHISEQLFPHDKSPTLS
jgi:hypothetical protein